MNRQTVARLGESLACEFLAGEGYTLRARNWRCSGGEIDIVAEKSGSLAIVEVKTRRSDQFGSGEDAVTARKLASLERCAWAYLEASGLMDTPWQIDVIAIDLDHEGRLTRLNHLQDVLQR